MIDVIIPSIKTEEEIFPLAAKMRETDEVNVILSCGNQSAAKNRNSGLARASSEYVIMCDDDIYGFFPGWASKLISLFKIGKNVRLVSARLIKASGAYATMMGSSYDKRSEYEVVKEKHVPSACIAFRLQGAPKFDEGFLGSGWEDTWFCDCLAKTEPEGLFIIDNSVKLIHRNEQKNQVINHEFNSAHYDNLRKNATKN